MTPLIWFFTSGLKGEPYLGILGVPIDSLDSVAIVLVRSILN